MLREEHRCKKILLLLSFYEEYKSKGFCRQHKCQEDLAKGVKEIVKSVRTIKIMEACCVSLAMKSEGKLFTKNLQNVT